MAPPKKDQEFPVKIINAEHISEPPNPNRVEMNNEKLQDLAQSIKDTGLQQPIIVRPKDGKFEIVAGHRRFKACLLVSIINIPCIVRDLSDAEAEQVKAHENLFRQDLSPTEEAIYIARLIDKDLSKIPEVAKRLSRSVAWVEERLAILEYPEYFWPAIESGQISLGVAKWLAPIKDDVYRKMFFDNAVNNGMKVFHAETCFRQWEAGILAPSEVIMPSADDKNPHPAPVFRVLCVKCGTSAENPNLQTVWIHKDCPGSEAGTGNP